MKVWLRKRVLPPEAVIRRADDIFGCLGNNRNSEYHRLIEHVRFSRRAHCIVVVPFFCMQAFAICKVKPKEADINR